ncbi:MAG: hypothetical protein WHS83_06485 [Chloroflexus sp.]|uniref:hypothetical protein n=1 Tax=Chloroflexus sp. TaxID=1904827 RepID=UPI0021DC2904|nr:MAG: hypothetical protein KatS3mg056_2858 [Chloroflexus sp.]
MVQVTQSSGRPDRGFFYLIVGAIFIGICLFVHNWITPSPHLSASGVVVEGTMRD